FEKLAHVHSFRTWHGHIVGCPWVSSNLILSPPGIAAGLIVHFEQHEILKTFFLQTPRSAKAGDPSTDNYNWNLHNPAGRGKACPVPQQMTLLKRIVYKGAGDGPLTFQRKPDERGAGRLQEGPA